MYTDEALTCTECGNDFALSAGERELFAVTGLSVPPGRCGACHTARRSVSGEFAVPRIWEMYTVTCSICAEPAEVPFQPRGDKPVYCATCFARARMH